MTGTAPGPEPATTGELLRRAAEHEQAGRLDDAESALDRILAAHADQPDAVHLKGVVAFKKGRADEGLRLMERSVAIGPPKPYYFRNLCELYRTLGRYDEALAAGRRAVAGNEFDQHSHSNLSVVHYARGEPVEAVAAAERALALDPSLPGAHFGLAEALLLQGEFARGWEEYEWRFRLPGIPALMPHTGLPQWDGAPIPDGRLLLIADQGFGDGIQFARYIPWAASRCGELAVACSKELHPVVSQLPGIATIFDQWEQCPQAAAYCPLSGLPRLHRTTLDSIPAQIPYLRADPAKIARWAARLSQLTAPGHRRIGLVWAGRPSHANDRNRSIPLATLDAIADLSGVSLISLQMGAARGAIGRYFGRAPLINLGAEIGDFADTMAIIAGLDLVITVDTAVAHLAGAMGAPVWILLPYAPDWRWLQDRADSPWYPTARLFRQPAPRRWDLVANAVADALRGRG
jgi:tetratricopeptide (TPR) repeat protein